MVLLQRQEEPEPGRWRTLGHGQAAEWRKSVREKMETMPRGVITTEFDVGRHNNIDETLTLNRETGVIERPKKEKPREPREAMEILTKMMIDSILEAPTRELQIRKVQLLKAQTVGLDHLTDDQALEQLASLAGKLVRRDAERRYAEMGLITPVDLGG